MTHEQAEWIAKRVPGADAYSPVESANHVNVRIQSGTFGAIDIDLNGNDFKVRLAKMGFPELNTEIINRITETLDNLMQALDDARAEGILPKQGNGRP